MAATCEGRGSTPAAEILWPGTPAPGCPTRTSQRISPARCLEGPAGLAARG